MARHSKKKARVIAMHPNQGRIVEAILFIFAEACERKIAVTQYDIVKSLFLADRAHLNKYGRPITFDNYVAMEHGPVPSTAYNFLKEDARALSKYGDVLVPDKSPGSRKIVRSLLCSQARTERGCFVAE